MNRGTPPTCIFALLLIWNVRPPALDPDPPIARSFCMYDLRPNLVMGFHGCDIRGRDKLLNHPNEIVISQKPYDWLGHGMYFWENNYARAMQWAEDKKRRCAIETPAVIGANQPAIIPPCKREYHHPLSGANVTWVRSDTTRPLPPPYSLLSAFTGLAVAARMV